MSSGIVEPSSQQPQDSKGQTETPGSPTRSKLVQRLLDASASLPAVTKDMLTTQDGQKDVFLQPGDVVYVPPRYVTEFSRWVNQALSPITAFTRVASSGAYSLAAVPRPF